MCAKLKYRFDDGTGCWIGGGGCRSMLLDEGLRLTIVTAQIDISWNGEAFQLPKRRKRGRDAAGKVDCWLLRQSNGSKVKLMFDFSFEKLDFAFGQKVCSQTDKQQQQQQWQRSSSRRKFFSFTTNLSNFRDLRCTFCSPRSLPRVLALRSSGPVPSPAKTKQRPSDF